MHHSRISYLRLLATRWLLLAAILAFLLARPAQAQQWTTSGNDIYNSNSMPGEHVCADAVRFIAAGALVTR